MWKIAMMRYIMQNSNITFLNFQIATYNTIQVVEIDSDEVSSVMMSQ